MTARLYLQTRGNGRRGFSFGWNDRRGWPVWFIELGFGEGFHVQLRRKAGR